MSAPLVIVHADDFGETVEITKGILECIEAGVVTSTSILANMPGTDFALGQALRRPGRRTSFGVHLNLCEGPSLTRPASFARADGTFLSKKQLFVRAVASRIDLLEVAAELSAQIRRIAASGVEVSHLDAHKHLHQLPRVSLVVAEVAKKFGIDRVRCTLEEGLWPKGARPRAVLARAVRKLLARRLKVRLQERGLRCPDRVFDLRELLAISEPAKCRKLLVRPGITEMFCHPATPLADREKPGSCSRAEESAYLRSAAFTGLVSDAGARLATWWEV